MASISKFNSDKLCCTAHPTPILIKDMICPECGLVVGNRALDFSCVSNAPENPLSNDSNLSGSSTEAAPTDKNGDPKYQNRRKKLRAERSLCKAFQEICAMARRLILTQSIVEHANNLFKQLQYNNSLRGRSNNAKASVCIYLACRQEGIPRTFKEICAVSKISRKEFGRCFKLCLKALDIKLDLMTASDFVPRFCSNLELPTEIQCAATQIAKKAMDMNAVPGRKPLSVAAAAIYMASQASEHKRTQKEISDITGVGIVTIQAVVSICESNLFPDNFIFTTPIELVPPIKGNYGNPMG